METGVEYSYGLGCTIRNKVAFCSPDDNLGSGKCLAKDIDALREAIAHGEETTKAVRTHTLQFFAFPVSTKDHWPEPTMPGVVALVPGKLYAVDNFLSSDQVDSLIASTRQFGHALPSGVGLGPTPYCEFRKSESWGVTAHEADYAAPGIVESIANLAAVNKEQLETMTVTRYNKGGYYSDHVDEELCDDQTKQDVGERSDVEPSSCGAADRRAHTVLIYLTSEKNDGATYFPHLNLRVFPQKGRALLFHPTTPSGQTDYDLVHGSEESHIGGKFVIQQWIKHGALSL